MRKQDAKDKRRYETFRFPFKFGYREIKSPDSHPGPAVLLRLILLHSSRCLIAHFAIVEAIIRIPETSLELHTGTHRKIKSHSRFSTNCAYSRKLLSSNGRCSLGFGSYMYFRSSRKR